MESAFAKNVVQVASLDNIQIDVDDGGSPPLTPPPPPSSNTITIRMTSRLLHRLAAHATTLPRTTTCGISSPFQGTAPGGSLLSRQLHVVCVAAMTTNPLMLGSSREQADGCYSDRHQRRMDYCSASYGSLIGKPRQLHHHHRHHHQRHHLQKITHFSSGIGRNNKTGGDNVAIPVVTADNKKITTLSLIAKKRRNQKITMVTAYDYPSAVHVDRAGIDVVLVGDSCAMVELGFETTLVCPSSCLLSS